VSTTTPLRDTVAVPFVDLWPAHALLREQILGDVADLLDSGAFTNGPAVAVFEADFAAYCGTRDCVGVASGLDALRLALLGLGVGRGDEVVVPALTFVATVEAVRQTGATPVLVDLAESDCCLDPAAVAAALTPRTRAILPVHLYGQLADLLPLTELAGRDDLALVEDAAQAHGAERDGFRAGSAGVAGCFSFYPSKNLGALGDAGAVTCSDADLAAALRALREHGQTAKYVHEREGYTARLDTLQALVLRRKLALLDGWNAERRFAAAWYLDRLGGVGDLGLPVPARGSAPVWHLFVVTTEAPDALGAFLGARGVATARHYPAPVHLTPAYRTLDHPRGAFPVAERLADTALSLPLFPGITEAQLERVADAVAEYFAG
jgi:dTDP-3-amino-3,4,6-trideoxy-alpha-D-glucose transaminase